MDDETMHGSTLQGCDTSGAVADTGHGRADMPRDVAVIPRVYLVTVAGILGTVGIGVGTWMTATHANLSVIRTQLQHVVQLQEAWKADDRDWKSEDREWKRTVLDRLNEHDRKILSIEERQRRTEAAQK